MTSLLKYVVGSIVSLRSYLSPDLRADLVDCLRPVWALFFWRTFACFNETHCLERYHLFLADPIHGRPSATSQA